MLEIVQYITTDLNVQEEAFTYKKNESFDAITMWHVFGTYYII